MVSVGACDLHSRACVTVCQSKMFCLQANGMALLGTQYTSHKRPTFGVQGQPGMGGYEALSPSLPSCPH